MRFFLLSITKIAHGHILFALNAEDREDEYHGEYGEEHAGDGADGEVEPENLLGAVGEEREEAEDGGDYGEGDRVRHVKFGEGTVVQINDGGRDFEVTVEFDQAGRKKMFASFAKLEKI